MASDRLATYRAKRDFKLTPEPTGGRHKTGRLSYLIQKHAARAEHYDFRLEHDGVLLSWAIPKGPSFNPADKRLAVRTEDHPIDYGDFEGTIPKGQYGGGTVMLWDRGTWEPQGDPDEGLAKGNFKFELHGARLNGGWALIRLRPRGRQDRGGNNWLLIKERDEAVDTGKPIVETATTSVKTGRTMAEIARGTDVWQANRAEHKKKAIATEGKSAKKPVKATAAGGKKKSKAGAAKIPAFVAPQLATLVDGPPDGDDWLHEIKYDGYRAVTSVAGDTVVIRTRTGLDWTDKFRSLVAPIAALPCDSALLDGEITVADADGRTNFGALQNAISEGRGGFGYHVFDLLDLDGEDLRARPLAERKAKLAKLMAKVGKNGPLLYSEHVAGQGAKVFRHACDLKLEGIISKRAGDRYVSGRTQSWLKSKCGMAQEFVIIGYRPSDKAGRPFASLLLGMREDGELRYAGRVGSGYSETRLDNLSALFARHARKTPPVADIPREISRDAHFLEPVLVAEIAFRGWTRDNLVRQGSFKGLRSDKPAAAIIRETPMPTAAVTGAKANKKSRAKPKANGAADNDTVAGVHISHPDRVIFKERGVTKRDLADYYMTVADVMLPHIVGRPLALVRGPQGSEGELFFQKHASRGWPGEFKEIRIREKSGSDKYLYIEDERGLVAAAQMGVLELHIWGSKVPDVEKPDRMVFDLDPDEGLDFDAVKDAARDLKKRLEDLGLESFAMVTGGKGIHVVVPLKPQHSWDLHRDFAEALARIMAEESPARYVANMAKAKRHGKIFIDYLRNQRGSTAIAPYSSRAKAGGYVAVPVTWQGLAKLKSSRPATVADGAKVVPARDPWPGYFKLRQALPVGHGGGSTRGKRR